MNTYKVFLIVYIGGRLMKLYKAFLLPVDSFLSGVSCEHLQNFLISGFADRGARANTYEVFLVPGAACEGLVVDAYKVLRIQVLLNSYVFTIPVLLVGACM